MCDPNPSYLLPNHLCYGDTVQEIGETLGTSSFQRGLSTGGDHWLAQRSRSGLKHRTIHKENYALKNPKNKIGPQWKISSEVSR